MRTPRYMLVSLLFLLHHCWLVYVQNAHSTLHAGFTSVSVAPLLVGLCSKCALHVTCWFHFCFCCTTVGWFMFKIRTPRYMLVSLLFLLHHCWLAYVQSAHSTLHAGFTSVSFAPLLVGLCSVGPFLPATSSSG